MAATTSYQAGAETTNTVISYAVEAVWGTKPAVAFQAIRYTGETLTGAKTRQRPTEIITTREASQAVTTQQTASGAINYAFSYATYDDFFACLLQNDWQALQTVAGVAADITITQSAGVTTLSSTTSSKFVNLAANTWIRLLGFTNATNNGFFFVKTHSSDVSLILTGPTAATTVTETPATTLAQIRASTIKNGTTFKSLWIQQKFASNQYLTYAGAYPTRMTIQGGIGAFLSGAVDLVAKAESEVSADGSTGATTAAPTGRVIDPIAGFVGLFWNDLPVTATVDQFAITIENIGAASEFGMGSANAAGILGGTFQASGTFRAYFKDFTYYDLFQAETSGRLAIIVKDSAGNGYAFTFLSAVLAADGVAVGGPNQPVYQNFTIEGGPSGVLGTFVIDRLAGS